MKHLRENVTTATLISGDSEDGPKSKSASSKPVMATETRKMAYTETKVRQIMVNNKLNTVLIHIVSLIQPSAKGKTSGSAYTPPPPPQFANDNGGLTEDELRSIPGLENISPSDIISSQTVSSKTRTVETITVSVPVLCWLSSHLILHFLFLPNSTKWRRTAYWRRASNRRLPYKVMAIQLTTTGHWLTPFKRRP